jgi:phosphatidylglycerophosphatase A
LQTNRVSEWIATVFFIGHLPLAPGTWSSFAALLVWWLAMGNISVVLFITLTVIIAAVGVVTSSQIVRHSQVTDPSRIVIDEWAGQWISLWGVPFHWGYGLGAFLLFRLFDIWKPYPISRMEKLPLGWGVMADDLGAGFLALISIHLIRLMGS